MSFLIIMIVFCVIVLVVVVIALVLSAQKKETGITKDYAEQAVMRRLKNGRTIGARFVETAERGYAWEFDVADSGRLYRVWVDGRTGVLFKAIDLQRANTPPGSTSKMVGKRIG